MPSTLDLTLLAASVEGPYWKSALEILCPPVGVSFYREFNWNERWVGASLMADLNDGRINRRRALVGMAFVSQANGHLSSRFVPLREATVALRYDGIVRAELILGQYVSPIPGAQLGDLAQVRLPEIEVPEARSHENGDPILARYADPGETATLDSMERSSQPDERLWWLLANSPQLPESVRERLRDTLVLYCGGLESVHDGTFLSPCNIQKSSNLGETNGFKLKVDSTYRVRLETRRIGSRGTQSFPKYPVYEFVTDQAQVVTSARLIAFDGNYRSPRPWIRPQVREVVPIDLWWHARTTGGNEQHNSTIDLRLPVTVKRSFPRWMALVAIFLLVAGAITVVWITRVKPGETSQVAGFVLIATVTLSFGVTTLIRVLDNWSRQR